MSQAELQFPLNELVDCPFEDYALAPGVNQSSLQDFLKSPRHYHYHHILGNKREETDALRFGKLLHIAVFEPTRFRLNYRVEPDVNRRTNEGKGILIKWRAELDHDAIVVSQKEALKLVGVIEAISRNKLITAMIKSGWAEKSIWWQDEEFGILCKARIDFITSQGDLLDLKSTSDPRWLSFKWSVQRYGYDVQAAWYMRGAERVLKEMGMKVNDFCWLAVETTAPYNPLVHRLMPPILGVGENKLKTAIKGIEQCKKTNNWPGYNDDKVVLADYDEWDLRRFAHYDQEETGNGDTDNDFPG